jgi:hypothetical protein
VKSIAISIQSQGKDFIVHKESREAGYNEEEGIDHWD